MTGVGCNDPNGDCPKVNFSKRSSLESGWAQGSYRPTTTSEALGTQIGQMANNDQGRVFYWSGAIVIVVVVTEATCNDPTGGHLEDDFSKRSSLESGWAQGSHWPTTIHEALDTQMDQLAFNDQGRVFYWFRVIVIAALVTGASCNDPTWDWRKVNFFKRSSSESLQGLRVGGRSQLLRPLAPRCFQLCHDDYWIFFYWSEVIVVALVEDRGR